MQIYEFSRRFENFVLKGQRFREAKGQSLKEILANINKKDVQKYVSIKTLNLCSFATLSLQEKSTSRISSTLSKTLFAKGQSGIIFKLFAFA